MILFTIFIMTLIILAIITAIIVGTGCAAFIVVFGDVIVFDLLIVFIVKHIKKRKKK